MDTRARRSPKLGRLASFSKIKLELIRYGIKTGEFNDVNIKEIVNIILYSYQGVRMWSRIIPMKQKTFHLILENIKRQLIEQ